MKQVKPKIDPEIRDLFGERDEAEYCQLKANIDLNGQLDEGIVWKETGILIDGHSRMEACDELGRNYRYKTLSFDSREEAIDWIFNHQFGRRNLSKDQRDRLIARRVAILKERKEESSQMRRIDPEATKVEGDVLEQVAKQVGVSRATVGRAVAKVESNFCERCTRTGMPVKNCPKCAGKMGGKKKKKANTKPTKGKIAVDWARCDRALKTVSTFFDSVAKHHPDEKKSDEYKAWDDLTVDLVKTFKKWQRRLT